MPNHPNFYESLKEAKMRINNTVVLYDDKPHYVCAVTDHKPDGKYRVYLDPFDQPNGLGINRVSVPVSYYPEGGMNHGAYFDEWLETPDGKASGIVRKMIDSPKFNKFRPFPIGMVNLRGSVYYVERQPVRISQQGLHSNMLVCNLLTLNKDTAKGRKSSPGRGVIGLSDQALGDTIMNKYPTAQECIENLTNPKCSNNGAAFDRAFAFLRGPVDTMFLCYKSDIIGFLPNGNLSEVVLSRGFKHTKEVLEACNIFADIRL